MKKNANRVTIKDVARLAGVTPQTVSRALGNAPDVSEATRKKILEIAKSINYVKNSTAYAFRGGRTKLIAVFYDNFTNLYFSIMMEYMQRQFSQKGYSLLPLTTLNATLDETAYKQAVSSNVDGIVSFLQADECIGELIENYGIPVTVFGRRSDIKHVDCVYTDDETGGRLAGRKFVEAGCKNVLYLTEVLTLNCALDRFNGLKEQLKQSGVKQPRVLIHNEMPMDKQFETLKNSSEGLPDAVFCFNDMIAFELLHLIERKKYPTMKIIGYDDVQSEIKIPKKLTSISSDKQKLVEQVVKIMTDKDEKGATARKIIKAEVSLSEGETA